MVSGNVYCWSCVNDDVSVSEWNNFYLKRNIRERIVKLAFNEKIDSVLNMSKILYWMKKKIE